MPFVRLTDRTHGSQPAACRRLDGSRSLAQLLPEAVVVFETEFAAEQLHSASSPSLYRSAQIAPGLLPSCLPPHRRGEDRNGCMVRLIWLSLCNEDQGVDYTGRRSYLARTSARKLAARSPFIWRPIGPRLRCLGQGWQAQNRQLRTDVVVRVLKFLGPWSNTGGQSVGSRRSTGRAHTRFLIFRWRLSPPRMAPTPGDERQGRRHQTA